MSKLPLHKLALSRFVGVMKQKPQKERANRSSVTQLRLQLKKLHYVYRPKIPTWDASILNKFPNYETMKSVSHLQPKGFIKQCLYSKLNQQTNKTEQILLLWFFFTHPKVGWIKWMWQVHKLNPNWQKKSWNGSRISRRDIMRLLNTLLQISVSSPSCLSPTVQFRKFSQRKFYWSRQVPLKIS